MRSSALKVFIVTGAFLLCPLSALSATLSFSPITDRGGSDLDNDGIYEDIEIESLEYSRVSDRNYDPHSKRVAMEFDLGFLTNSNININSAQFVFSATSYTNGDGGLEVHGYYGDGVITGDDMTVTNFIGGPFRPRDINSDNRRHTLDVTSMFDSISGSDYLGFRFGLYHDYDNFFINVNTKEASDPFYRPTLLVDYTVSPVPIPAAVWLFSSGLIGLVGLARLKITY